MALCVNDTSIKGYPFLVESSPKILYKNSLEEQQTKANPLEV